MKSFLIFLVLFVLFFSCKKEPTVWDTNWSAPLINDTLDLSKLVNDTTLSESGGFYQLELDRNLFDLNISELIEIPDTTITENFTFTGTLTIGPGFNFVNSVEEHNMNLEDIELKLIILKEGFIDVKVENPLATKTIFQVQLPGVTKNGITFNQEYEAPASSNGTPGVVFESIDLSGYKMNLTGVSGGEVNFLRSQITVKTDPNGPSVEITPSDVTKVNATFRDVKVDYAKGYFGNKLFSDTTEVIIDQLSNVTSGTIDIPATTIEFIIENGIKVSAQAKLTTVKNVNSTGNTVNLTGVNIGALFDLNPANGSWSTLTPSIKTITFDNANSNIEAYIENLGALHTLGYRMQLNPWGNVSGSNDELFSNSTLRVRMKANMPLAIGIDDLILKDTFDITLNQDPDKTRIKSGELTLEARNGFPISGNVIIHFLDENGTILQSVTGSHPLQSSIYGSMDSNVGINVSTSVIQFVLSEEVLNDVDQVRSLIIESGFNTFNSFTGTTDQVSIPVGAFLAVNLKAKFISENKL